MAASAGRQQWFPLESNPDVMNSYIKKLGFDTSKFQFVDVLSTDDWALEMVPRPTVAVMLLFPISQACREFEAAERDRIASEGQTVSENLWFTRQTIGNACGTIGLLHSTVNAAKVAPLSGWLQDFAAKADALSPDERGTLLEGADDLAEAHEQSANEGSSEVSEEVARNIDTHFIAFVHCDGHLYELDGRKSHPINHGKSSSETLLNDACKVIKTVFMERQPGELRFAITALCQAQS